MPNVYRNSLENKEDYTLKLHIDRLIHLQLPLELSSRKFEFLGADY